MKNKQIDKLWIIANKLRGAFEVTERPEHMGVNPKTGESILIKASKSPKFKASKLLKDRVNV